MMLAGLTTLIIVGAAPVGTVERAAAGRWRAEELWALDIGTDDLSSGKEGWESASKKSVRKKVFVREM